MLKILFTSGGSAGMEALWSLYDGMYEMHFADAACERIHPIIPIRNRHKIPMAYDPIFFEEVIHLCKILRIDIFIPGVDEELLIISKSIHKFGNTKVLVPTYTFVESMLDKLNMAKIMHSNSLPVPVTYSLKNSSNYSIKYPCIIKPRKGRGSRGVMVINNKNEVESLKKLYADVLDDYIIQNKPEGEEYTVQMVANSSKSLFAIIPVKVGYKRGITIIAEVDNNSDVVRGCELIHKANPTKGCYNIQLILTSDGTIMPFEINPRISTTYCLTVASGIDPIDIFSQNDNLNGLMKIKKSNVKLHRHWNNFISQ